jgi:hypothetical protein
VDSRKCRTIFFITVKSVTSTAATSFAKTTQVVQSARRSTRPKKRLRMDPGSDYDCHMFASRNCYQPQQCGIFPEHDDYGGALLSRICEVNLWQPHRNRVASQVDVKHQAINNSPHGDKKCVNLSVIGSSVDC